MDSQCSENDLNDLKKTSPKNSNAADVSGTGWSDSPSSKEEELEVENEAVEECSVCRNEMIDTTVLSDCVHEFCYHCIIQWLTKGTGPFCPMCKAPVKFIKRKGTDKEIPLEQIQLEKEPEATASEDIITEKRIVSKKIRECRRLMNQIDEIIGSSSRLDSSKRQKRIEELNTMKQMCVAQLNSLQMLRDDIDHGAAKALIVSRPEFRRLIYERAVMIEGSEHDRRRITNDQFLANIEHYRAVLNAYFTVELKSLPVANQPKVDSQNRWNFYTVHDVIQGKDEEFVHKLFCMISERGVNELTASDIEEVLNNLVSHRVAATFLGEIISLVNSKKTFLDWCGSVLYRNRSDLLGRNVAPEVVTVDDSIEVDEPSSSNSRHGDTRSRRHPVYNPFDSVFGQPMNFNHHFHNNRRPSSSDTDQDEDIYFQAPLRIGPRNPNVFRPSHRFFPAVPPAGVLWSDLTRTTDKPTSAGSLASSSRNVPLVNLDDDDDEDDGNEEDVRSSSSSVSNDNEDIQVVDNEDTIVLSDSPAIHVPTERKRKSNSRLGDLYKRSKIEELPEGLVEDVKQLISKYNVPIVQAMNIMVNAAQEAIQQSTATQPVNLLATSQNRNEQSATTNLQPDDALQVAGSSDLARNGMGPWSRSELTRPNRWDF